METHSVAGRDGRLNPKDVLLGADRLAVDRNDQVVLAEPDLL